MKPTTPAAHKLFQDGTLALAHVEANGMRVDMDYVDRTRLECRQRIKDLETALSADPFYKTWKRHFGAKTNLTSRAQLGQMIERELGVTVTVAQGKTRASWDEAALEKVELPFVVKYLEAEKLRKAEGTFLKGIREECVDGFLHPHFHLNTVVSYRGSSSDPNFQNFPVRNPLIAKLIRSCFIARDNHQIVENDFGGIEVMVATCYHQDPTMKAYLEDPKSDMHRDTACSLFLLKPHEVEKNVRHAAKNGFVFPEFYGDWFLHCAANIWEAMQRFNFQKPGYGSVEDWLKSKGITRLGNQDSTKPPVKGTFEHHVKKVEDQFWNERFPVYTKWKERHWKRYCERGWFHTLTGFTCSGLYQRNQVINFPVQGSAFHCLLFTLIRLVKELKKRKMKSKVVGQIHDSIIGDVHRRELDDYLQLVKWIATDVLFEAWEWLIMPMKIEAEVCAPGASWFDKQVVAL